MKNTRVFAGLGLAALLTITAACGSDKESEAPAAKEGNSAEHTTATPEGTAMLYMKATAESDFKTICTITTDGEAPMGSTDEDIASCTAMVEALFSEEDEQTKTIIAEAKTALADGPSKVEELTETTAQVSFAAVNGGEPTGLTKLGDEWFINMYG